MQSYSVVCGSFLLLYYAGTVTTQRGQRAEYPNTDIIDISFLVFYWVEALLKLFAFGFQGYFRSGWNRPVNAFLLRVLAVAH